MTSVLSGVATVRRALSAAALCALVVSAAPVGAQPEHLARVLVMPFVVSVDPGASAGAGASYWLGEAAAILLTDGLQQAGIGVLSRDERVAAFERLQLPMSSTLTRATMLRVAEIVGASDLVFGEIAVDGTLSVRARMVRLDLDRELAPVAASGAMSDLFDVFSRAARGLSSGKGRPPSPAAAVPAPLPSLEAFQNYVKGLVAATPAAQQRFFETALKDAPRNPRVLTALWAVYTAEGAHEKALGVASQVPAGGPLSRRARFSAALSLIELGRLDGAAHALAALSSERPAAVLANALGVVDLRRGSAAPPGTAVADFKRALAQDANNVDYLFNLGYAYALAKDMPSAVAWLREAVRRDVANGDAHLVLSAALAATGKTAESARELELAKLVGARSSAVPAALTEVVPAGLERLPTDLDAVPGQEVAAAIGRPAQRQQQETASYYLETGRRLFAERKDREAVSALQRAVYLSPYEDEPHVLLGRLYARAGRVSEAVDELRIAIWCRETAAAHAALGAALLASGDKDAARREAQRALALDPGLAEARDLLRKIGG